MSDRTKHLVCSFDEVEIPPGEEGQLTLISALSMVPEYIFFPHELASRIVAEDKLWIGPTQFEMFGDAAHGFEVLFTLILTGEKVRLRVRNVSREPLNVTGELCARPPSAQDEVRSTPFTRPLT